MKPNQLEEIKRGGEVKMAKSTISPEVLKIIKKSVDEAVKKAAEAIIKANKELDESQRNYFKETERLLYSLPVLKLKVAQDEEDSRVEVRITERKEYLSNIGLRGGDLV